MNTSPSVPFASRLFGSLSGPALHAIARMMMHLSNTNESPVRFACEVTENSMDGEAPDISIVLRAEQDKTNSLIFVDNGHGLVPYLLDADLRTLQGYFLDMENGTYDPNLKIADYVDKTSRYSLEWVSALPAFSQKTATEEEEKDSQYGIRGLGLMGFRQYAQRCVIVSRPDPELARGFYGPADPRAIDPPTYTLELPTLNDLRHGRIEGKIELSSKPLVDPSKPGSPEMAYGTVVYVYGLSIDAVNALKPKSLQQKFGDIYQDRIRDGVRLRVVDMMTRTRGQRTPSGLSYVIQARSYTGTKIVDQRIQLPEFGTSFHVQLHYDHHSKDVYPKYRRKGGGRLHITALPAFARGPWVSGRLDGHIDYPNLPEAVAPWDMNKIVPVEGRVRTAWEKALRAIEPYIEKEIRRIDDSIRKDRSTRELETLSKHLLAALGEVEGLPDLMGDSSVGVGTGGSSGITRIRTGKTPPHVVVRIKDKETGRGVKDVMVQFFKFTDKEHFRRSYAHAIGVPWTTGISGQITQTNFFHVHGAGRYRVRIVLPAGTYFAEGETDEQEFVLRLDKPHQRIEFMVHANMEPVQIQRLPRGFDLGLNYNDSLPEDIMYDGRRIESSHIIDINSRHPLFLALSDIGKPELYAHIMSCAAHAVILHTCGSFPAEDQLIFAAELTSRAIARARGK